MGEQQISRRDFLRIAGMGAVTVLTDRLYPSGYRVATARQVQNEPFVPDAEVSITAQEKTVQILSGAPTRAWGYEGKLISGSGVTVDPVPGSYLGPILRVRSGTKLRIYFNNNLAEKSILHPHGLRVPENCDGHPMYAIGPGQTKIYEFQVIDPARPAWFHPHPMSRTAEQVAMGLAGLFYVWDQDEEMAVPGASSGANDLPVVIQDRMFDSNNQFLYSPNMMWGLLGDHILVNGKPDANFSLEPRAYRMRLINGSNARTYKLGWSNGMPLQIIGTDGGLLPAAVSRNYVMLMPGERIDLWVDFNALAGKQVVLRSLAFEAGGMMGMGSGSMGRMGGGGMMGMMGSALANGAAFDILTVNVGQTAGTNPVLGALPAMPIRYDASNVPNYARPRTVTLSMGHMMTWMMNGRVYEDNAVANDEKVYHDATIAWEWVNLSPIPHPMHIHNIQFQVVQRNTAAVPASYRTVNEGLIDSGWKDTVLVWPGERVKVAMTFGPYTGMYMYHCHILEHEDMTMMRNFLIL